MYESHGRLRIMARKHGKHRKYRREGISRFSSRVTLDPERTGMTLTQKFTLLGAITAVLIISLLQITMNHISPIFPTFIILAWNLMSGIGIGIMIHKRKRDKDMAGLVAERLMGRKNLVQYDNAGWAQQVMAQQANSGIANNPNIGNVQQGLLGRLHGSSLGKQ